MTTRYLYAKSHRDSYGHQVWGVYDNELKKFAETGFLTVAAVRRAAAEWNKL